MKLYGKIYLLLFFIFFTLKSMNSQTYAEKSEEEKVLSGETLDPTILASFGLTTTINPRNAEITGNSVFLRQIGELNEVNVLTNTQSSEINITQNGDYNKTDLRYSAKTAVSEIFQNGDYNKIQDFVNDPTQDISLDLLQEGDYLNFERQGVNELTKSLKFKQTQASPSIIIRSFN